MRYFFEICYNGMPYHGWQNQPNAISVQQVVEDSMTKVFRKKTPVVASGRTDTGVHCVKQYFHADVDASF
jgi:tRNA pseudouridine38-40 synthase